MLQNKLKTLGAVAAFAVTSVVMSVAAFAAPGAVTGIHQEDASKSSVKVAWTADVSATKYYTRYSNDGVNWGSEDYSYSATDTKSSLSEGQTIYVQVCAADKSGRGPWSDAFQLVTAPSDISSASFVNATSTTCILNWAPATGADGYVITYASNTYDVGNVTSAEIPYLAGETYARVYAYRTSASGYKAMGSYAYKTVYGLKVLPGRYDKNSFGLTSAYASIGVIYVGVVGGDSIQAEVATIKVSKKGKITYKTAATAEGSSARFSNIKQGKAYAYRVRPYITTDAGKVYGEWSNYRYYGASKSAKYSTSNKKISLKWSKISGMNWAKISISTKEDKGYKKVAIVNASKKKYTISKIGKKNLKKGKSYWVKLEFYINGSKKKVKTATGSDFIYKQKITVK